MFAGTTNPSGWLLCDGTAVSRTTYAALFTALGTTFGAGDGSTTFNLPSMASKFPRGAATPSTGGGSDTHSHTLSDAGAAKVSRGNNRVIIQQVTTAAYTGTDEVTGTGAGGATARTTGSGLIGSTDSGSTIPAYVSLRFIIKT
jgi:microcystin-dependent protein